MDFDATVAWPVYDWMGVAKAALEATSRYLARDLGPRGVRVNLVSAGPIGTIAARGIPGFSQLADAWEKQAPLGWDDRRRRARSRARSASCSPTSRARSPARSSTSTAASTRWARRSRAWRGRPSGRSRRRPRHEPRVLLTGATGFLGMEVLARLLERTDREVALPRPRADGAAAEARLDGVLATLYREPSPYRDARHARSRGDLTGRRRRARTRTSTSSATARRRSRSTSRSTRRARSTSRARARCSSSPARAGARRFVHVSTAYVSGTHAGRFTEDMLGTRVPQHLRADQVRGRAASSRDVAGMEVAIARPSIVMGESDTGWTPAFNVLYWPLRAFARGLFEPVPARPDGRVDVVPVDYVADGIVDADRAPTRPARSTSSAGESAATRRRARRRSPARTSTARARPTSRPARSAAPRPTSTARSTCRTSTWRSCSTTRARASCSGCRRRALRELLRHAAGLRRPRAWGKRGTPRDQARATYAASRVGRARARRCTLLGASSRAAPASAARRPRPRSRRRRTRRRRERERVAARQRAGAGRAVARAAPRCAPSRAWPARRGRRAARPAASC